MDRFKHPLDRILLARVSMSSINYRVDLESEYTNHLFANHPSAVIAMERYYQKRTIILSKLMHFALPLYR